MPRESTLRNSVMAYALKAGCYAVKIHGSLFSKGGMPDLVVLVPVVYQDCAVPLFIELKKPGSGNEPDPRQKKRLRELEKAGAVAIWASNLDTVKAAIASITRGTLE